MFESLSTLFFVTQIFGILLNAGLVALFIWVVGRAYEARPDILGAPAADAAAAAASRRSKAVQEAWAIIEKQASRGPEGKRLAVIDSDRLADRLLKDAGYEGDGALDRMRQLPGDRLATVGDLISAHRFRNRLVHEVGFHPNDRDLDSALAQYKAFLTEVGYL